MAEYHQRAVAGVLASCAVCRSQFQAHGFQTQATKRSVHCGTPYAAARAFATSADEAAKTICTLQERTHFMDWLDLDVDPDTVRALDGFAGLRAGGRHISAGNGDDRPDLQHLTLRGVAGGADLAHRVAAGDVSGTAGGKAVQDQVQIGTDHESGVHGRCLLRAPNVHMRRRNCLQEAARFVVG